MPTESDASTPHERIDLGDEASLQVARALNRPARMVPELLEASLQVARALNRPARMVPELLALFTDDHDRPPDNTGHGDGSPT